MGSPISLAFAAVYVSMLLASIENALALPLCQTNIESETGKQPYTVRLFQVIFLKGIEQSFGRKNFVDAINHRLERASA